VKTNRIDTGFPLPQVEPDSAPRRGPRSTDFEQSLDRLLDATPKAQPAPKPADGGEAAPGAGLKFSRHASARMQSRGIELSEEELEKLQNAVDALDRRGAKESLVLLGDRAYVVGVPNKTVITVVDRAEALGTIFTNIDSTFVAG
jgi:flagellar operon protein